MNSRGNAIAANAAVADALPCFTRRLVLRRFAAGDLALFQAYRHDPEVGRYQGWNATDDDPAAAFLAAMAVAKFGVPGEWVQIAVADRATTDLVGDIGVGLCKDRASVAEIGFSMAPAAQRRGLGAEAVGAALRIVFECGIVDSVEGITDARNVASIRLLERIGMRRVRAQEVEFKGAMCTEHVYALSRAQWIETSRG